MKDAQSVGLSGQNHRRRARLRHPHNVRRARPAATFGLLLLQQEGPRGSVPCGVQRNGCLRRERNQRDALKAGDAGAQEGARAGARRDISLQNSLPRLTLLLPKGSQASHHHPSQFRPASQ
eukprot:CAMPEP_0177768342 /NCGR_PEP_ID=MMETSP0491_2-20121128/9665_1 /TAXON_ID=63592 /ORGANISM="Tetraselmis chuii, Strain PLY429" /LENGTH=120 /DNA_ID=CAMNT_0019285133 /DNA_START=152 /DNA_END=514 /DNA_ORIENTATION=-